MVCHAICFASAWYVLCLVCPSTLTFGRSRTSHSHVYRGNNMSSLQRVVLVRKLEPSLCAGISRCSGFHQHQVHPTSHATPLCRQFFQCCAIWFDPFLWPDQGRARRTSPSFQVSIHQTHRYVHILPIFSGNGAHSYIALLSIDLTIVDEVRCIGGQGHSRDAILDFYEYCRWSKRIGNLYRGMVLSPIHRASWLIVCRWSSSRSS